MQRYFYRALAAFLLMICNRPLGRAASVTLFDGFTGATQSYSILSPRTFIGFAGTMGSAGGSTNISVTSGNAYLIAMASVSYTNIRLNLKFWGTVSGATSGTTQAFSNLLGSYSFDLGALNTTAFTLYPYAFTLPSTLILPAQTCGVTVNWQGDTGGGLVSTDNLTSMVRLGPAPATGSLSVGAAGQYGFYSNTSGQADGSFPGSDFTYYEGQTNQGLGLQLFGPASTGFTAWAQTKFTYAEFVDTSVSGPNAVYGLDGLSNLVKYALGLEPKTNITSGLPAVSVVGSDWVFTYVRTSGLTDITYAVEVSTDLATWTTTGVTHEQVSSGGGTETWRGRYPLASATNAFFRLNVTQN